MIYNIDENINKTAIIHNDKKYSFEDLSFEIKKYCHEIDVIKIKNGEIVVILGDYSFNAIALFIALYIKKAILVPITTKVITEIEERIEQVNADWIWNLDNNKINKYEKKQFIDTHQLIIDLNNKEAAGLILFSSGSTGKAKSMLHNLDNLVSSHNGKKRKDLIFLIFLMFDHIGGLNTLLNCLASGATMVIPKSRKPEEICELIEKYSINILPSSPTFLNLIIISGAFRKFNLESIKMITYGTEPMPETLLIKLKDVFKKAKFLQTFGTSETGIFKTTSLSSTSTFLKFDDPDQEYKIVNNELWLRSKTQIIGYMNHTNESFTSDGWFKTGDVVEEIEGGFMKIIGRAKEVINVGGEKVLPEEVESVILELPEISDCLVYGIKNTITGQMVGADILPIKNIDLSHLKISLKKHCQLKLASYKVPIKINFVDKINYTERFKKIRNLS
jgi:acyl-coenzyme A synthetase/AMP-(fatty) acid ligase